jgi:tetratricopeptide (TPR) repeat protein
LTARPRKNAIERRLEEIESVWIEFASNDQARLLRFVVDEDEVKLLDAFLELQNEEVSEIPDLFLRFNEPFDDPASYGLTLRESLIEQYEEVREGIAAEGIPADWQCPPLMDGRSDIANFLKAAASLYEKYRGIMENLVAVLTPLAVADQTAWRHWLRRLVSRRDLPQGIRFLVLDSTVVRVLDGLAEAEPQQVVTETPDLDMPGAYAELVRGTPGAGPGFAFRRLFVALTNAAAVGNVAVAARAARRAQAIAQANSWPQLVTAVQMALGAAYFSAGDVAMTLKCYRAANKAIQGSSEPGSEKLDIQTRFAEAAALISDEKYEDAAEVYQQIGPLAEKQKDAFSALEAWRMAAWCRETLGDKEGAWDHAVKALDAGARLEEPVRPDSTLPYVGQLMLRLIADGVNPDQEGMVRRRMVELVGEGWEDRIEQGAAPS